MSILQLVPRIAPGQDGVGDYAERLAEALRAHHVVTRFVATRSNMATIEGSAIVQAGDEPARYAMALRDAAAGQSAILLHYVGYGYARRGAPWWLPRALRDVCRATGLPLLTVFHELYAMGLPWQSSFWLSPMQRAIAARLARSSSAVFCTRASAGAWLRRQAPRVPVHVQPVFSNVGEPTQVPRWEDRAAALVLFGHGAFKRRILGDEARVLAVCRRLGVREMIQIGESVPVPPAVAAAVSQRDLGRLEAGQVGAVLAASRYLAFNYFPGYLGKSSVLAAAAAHGTVPIGFGIDGDVAEGLLPGVHVWSAEVVLTGDARPDGATAAALKRWYDAHDRAAHARNVAASLQELTLHAA